MVLAQGHGYIPAKIHTGPHRMAMRSAVEDMYLKGVLRVVVATSTLAVGVNLRMYFVEFSDQF